MSRPVFMLICIGVVLLVLALMWVAWRARANRDRGVIDGMQPLSGGILATFDRVSYVSTTPVGQPLTRVAIPGLRYRGPAEVTVRADGVSVQVHGEDALHLHRELLRGTATAGVRVGKAVEGGGLLLLLWSRRGEPGEYESSFRFANRTDQHEFEAALASIMNDHTTLEDA